MAFPRENVAVRCQSFAGHVSHWVSNTRRPRENPPSSDPRKPSAKAPGRLPGRSAGATSKPTPCRSGARSDAGRIPVGAGPQFPPRRGIESDSVGGADWIHPRTPSDREMRGDSQGLGPAPMRLRRPRCRRLETPRASRGTSTPVASERRLATHRVSGPSTPRESGGHNTRMPSHVERCAPALRRISGPSVPRGGTRGVCCSAKPVATVAAKITANAVTSIVRCISLLPYRTLSYGAISVSSPRGFAENIFPSTVHPVLGWK